MRDLKKLLPAPAYLAHGFVGLAVMLVLAPLGLLLGVAGAWTAGVCGELFDMLKNKEAEEEGLPPPYTDDWLDVLWTGGPATLLGVWLGFWWDVGFPPVWWAGFLR